MLVLGICLTAGSGAVLFALPGRTGDYWAWRIGAPPTAAFLGAGYVGAVLALGLAARETRWQRARIVVVVAFTLTTLTLAVTLTHLDTFAFGAGAVVEAVAWVWLAVYAVLPPLALAAFVLQERAGGAREYAPDPPARPVTRVALGLAGAVLALVGTALVLDWDALTTRWPWPLPPLSAGAVGGWLCTYGAGFLWFALRERDWGRGRILAAPAAVTIVLDLASALRLREDFEGGVATALYVGGLATLLLLVTSAALLEHPAARPRLPVTGTGTSRRRPTS
jgi:hypothetical protein